VFPQVRRRVTELFGSDSCRAIPVEDASEIVQRGVESPSESGDGRERGCRYPTGLDLAKCLRRDAGRRSDPAQSSITAQFSQSGAKSSAGSLLFRRQRIPNHDHNVVGLVYKYQAVSVFLYRAIVEKGTTWSS